MLSFYLFKDCDDIYGTVDPILLDVRRLFIHPNPTRTSVSIELITRNPKWRLYRMKELRVSRVL